MFNHAIVRQGVPRHLSSDNDPLFDFHRWNANLRVLDVDELKTVPYTPTSHPFAERLMGTIRREYLDNVFLWNTVDLEKTVGIQCLLQPTSRSQLSGWPNASQSQRGTRQYAYGAPPFPLANSLPRAIRAAGGRYYQFATLTDKHHSVPLNETSRQTIMNRLRFRAKHCPARSLSDLGVRSEGRRDRVQFFPRLRRIVGSI